MNLVDFIAEHLPDDYSFKITKELSFEFEDGYDNAILKTQQGKQYRKGVIMPVFLTITSKDTTNAIKIWSDWVKEVSDKDYQEGTSNFYMIFQTPSVAQVFDELKTNYYSTVSIIGTIVVTENVMDIKSLKIDDDEITVNDWAFKLTSTPDSEQPVAEDEGYINTSEITASVLTMQVTTFNEDYANIRQKLTNMRKNSKNPNDMFHVKITWADDSYEEYDMKCTSQAFQKSRGAILSVTLDFAK